MDTKILAALVLLSACAGDLPQPDYLVQPEPFRAEVSYWGDADPAIDMLHMVGFELVQAADQEHAQVVIHDRKGPFCDGVKLAYATDCGGVWLCGPVSATVLAHEIGHTLGVHHVSELEGLAVMNTHADIAVRMTELDAEAFIHRHLEGSVFDPKCR